MTKDLSNQELLSNYKDAICDMHYNPSSEDYNKSWFSLSELEEEIFNRLGEKYYGEES